MIRCTPACSSFFKTSTRKVRKPVELQPEGIIWLLLLRFCSSLNHVITCVRDCRPTECHLVFSRCCCSMHLAPNHTQLRCIVATFRITSYRDMGHGRFCTPNDRIQGFGCLCVLLHLHHIVLHACLIASFLSTTPLQLCNTFMYATATCREVDSISVLWKNGLACGNCFRMTGVSLW